MAMNSINIPALAPTFLGQDTPARVFQKRCQDWADRPALRHKKHGLWQTITWQQYYEHVQAVGLALLNLGLQSGDGVCVLAENRPEWLYVDMAAQCLGMVGNGIYPTSSPKQLQHILIDSGTRVLFVENQEQLDKVLEVLDECAELQHIVVMEQEGLREFTNRQVSFFDDFLKQGKSLGTTQAAVFEKSIAATRSDALAFLVYTSGTTGAPKGAMILNSNLVFQLSLATEYLDVQEGDKSLSFLPLCHIAERMSSVYNPLAVGLIVHFPENASTVFNDIREVAPHVVFAPPRFWEKMYSQIELFMRDAVAPARWMYQTAQSMGLAQVSARLNGQGSRGNGLLESAIRWVAMRNVRVFLGLQNVKTALTGAAPVPPDLIRWYLSCDIELREAFGMTETTGFCTATPKGGIRLGWAGTKAPGTEIRIGNENEILIRGHNVFGGYWNLPDKTREALDDDGWLHTGDCGEIDGDGYLAIRDRIKDILITSGGKNITPSHIESLLKFSPYITDAVVIGDARKYLTCLIMIDQEHVARYAQEHQVPYTDFSSLTRRPEIVSLIQVEVDRINAQLARVEQIKEFRIIAELLTAEDDELTPTMKLKRKVIATKYAEMIEMMYRTRDAASG